MTEKKDKYQIALEDALAIEFGRVIHLLETCGNHDDFVYYTNRKECIETLLFEKSPTSKMQ